MLEELVVLGRLRVQPGRVVVGGASLAHGTLLVPAGRDTSKLLLSPEEGHDPFLLRTALATREGRVRIGLGRVSGALLGTLSQRIPPGSNRNPPGYCSM